MVLKCNSLSILIQFLIHFSVVLCYPIQDNSNKLQFVAEVDIVETWPDIQLDDYMVSRSSLSAQQSKNVKSIGGDVECFLCKNTMNIALWKFKNPEKNYTELFKFAIGVCIYLDIEESEVCKGIVNAMKNETQYLLSTIPVNGEMICGLVFPTKCKTSALSWNGNKWLVPIPKPLDELPSKQAKPPSGEVLKVLQVSDIHVDLLYKPGSQVKCDEPLCCRKSSPDDDEVSGYWGSYGSCDIPYWTLENFLSTVSKESFDYIMWTGDLPAHDVWNQTRDSQLYLLSNLTSVLLKHFPSTPIYPSLGNHESYPVNSFPPNYINDYDKISWLYDGLEKAWAPWLDEEALVSVKQSGYYTTLFKPGLRIISLNMNYCNDENFWMLENPVDPNGELKWLVDTLLKAEKNGEKVHIMGHIPPKIGGDCLEVWRNNFYDIVARFKHTIKAQFFGHTHHDEFEILYPDNTLEKPIAVSYTSPSLTSYSNLNPGYRVYEMDSISWEIRDHHTFILDFAKANQPGATPVWELEYSAKQAYNLTSMSPEEWHEVYKRWLASPGEDEGFFQKYYTYFYKRHVPAASCDETCRKSLLCGIAAGNFTVSACS